MRYYIIRREEPFQKGTEEYYGSEDEFTLGSKMVFIGLILPLTSPLDDRAIFYYFNEISFTVTSACVQPY